MARKRKIRAPWVVAFGAIGELAHCTRCGEGLSLKMPVRIEVMCGASDGFLRAHEHCVERGYVEPEPQTPEEWIKSRDVGTSSVTIWSVMTGLPSPYGEYAAPSDDEDFARCARLLKRFPQWLPRLDEVTAGYPFMADAVRRLKEEMNG